MVHRKRASTRLHDDPGLQPERTSLSWARTALSLILLLLIYLRFGIFAPAPTFIALILVGAIYLTATRRYQGSSTGVAHENYRPATYLVLTTAFLICTISVSLFATLLLEAR